MKKITRTFYVATDGQEFSSKAECLQYEADGCVWMEPIPTYCDHVPFSSGALQWMSQGDGDWHYATATRYARSFMGSGRPDWATHLVYFGK